MKSLSKLSICVCVPRFHSVDDHDYGTLIPQYVEEKPDVSILVLKNILFLADNFMDPLYAKDNTILKVVELIKTLLYLGCSLWFAEYCMVVVKHI